MADHKEDVEQELKGVHATFKEKSADLKTQTSDGAKGAGGWTKQHAAVLHKDLDKALHGLKVKLSRSDHPAHEGLEEKVDEARGLLEEEFESVEEGDHHKAASIVDRFHHRVDEWMEDIQAHDREW